MKGGGQQLIHLFDLVQLFEDMGDWYDMSREMVETRIARKTFQSLQDGTMTWEKVERVNGLADITADYLDHMIEREESFEMLEKEDVKGTLQSVRTEFEDLCHRMIHYVAPIAFFKALWNREEELTPVEALFVYNDMGAVQGVFLSHLQCVNKRLDMCLKRYKRVQKGKCRFCGKHKIVRKCKRCQRVGYCSGVCHRKDMQDEMLGHNVIECELIY